MSEILESTPERFNEAIKYLSKLDPDLKQIIKIYGTPPEFSRKDGFETLIKIIIEQMLSNASADAIFARLKTLAGKITPENIVSLTIEQMRGIGLSNQKSQYCKNIADAVINKTINFKKLKTMTDDEVLKTLTSVKGIGEWTAYIYLISAMHRPDIWPVGDHALALAVQRVKKLPEYPEKKILREFGNQYKPYRTIAALIFWHSYSNN